MTYILIQRNLALNLAGEFFVFAGSLNVVKCQSMFVTTGYDGDWPGTEQSSHRDLAETRRPGPEPSSDWASLRGHSAQPQTAGAEMGRMVPLLSLTPGDWRPSLHTPMLHRPGQIWPKYDMKYLFITENIVVLELFFN